MSTHDKDALDFLKQLTSFGQDDRQEYVSLPEDQMPPEPEPKQTPAPAPKRAMSKPAAQTELNPEPAISVDELMSMDMTRENNLEDRKARFNDMMTRLGEVRGEEALKKMQVSPANPMAELGNRGNMDEAIAKRNEAQRTNQLLRAFNKIIQGSTTAAGGKITDGSELFDELDKQADQPVRDIAMKEKMQQTRDDQSRAQEKYEVVMDKLKMDLEKSNLDFQNAEAVADPNSPQSKMVQEYFIEMNAAMGRKVNPETVMQQPAQMLYKISPWMQNVYATHLRMQMDQRRLNQQDERIAQGRERLDLLTGKEGRLKDQFDKKFEDTQQEQSAKIVDKFEKDKVVQKSNESIGQANNVIQLVQSDNPIGHSAIPTFMARAAGEVGNLSEGDKAPFGGSQALSARIKQVTQTYRNGELTPENQQFVIDLANVMKKSAMRNKATRAFDLRGKYGKSYKMDTKDVNDLMMPELNQLDNEDQAAVEWALANPSNPKADAILKLHGM